MKPKKKVMHTVKTTINWLMAEKTEKDLEEIVVIMNEFMNPSKEVQAIYDKMGIDYVKEYCQKHLLIDYTHLCEYVKEEIEEHTMQGYYTDFEICFLTPGNPVLFALHAEKNGYAQKEFPCDFSNGKITWGEMFPLAKLIQKYLVKK